MIDNKNFYKKVAEAKSLIREALKKHNNSIYVAYSGGKDSKVLLGMVKSIQQDVLVIHNCHEGEVCDKKGVLLIKGPKKEVVPKALAFLDITAQLDGTRQDEDDYVMIDGVDIHRSKMESNYTENGVWGLNVYFPLMQFTEEEIYYYLNIYGE